MAVGQPAPRFEVTGAGGRKVNFDSLAGRYIVLGFIGRAQGEAASTVVRAAQEAGRLFDGTNATLFWVSVDPTDEAERRLSQNETRMGVFWDYDFAISRAFNVARPAPEGMLYRPSWIVLDPRLRVLKSAPIADIVDVIGFVGSLPPPDAYDGDLPAPVLVTPRLFEPELCRALIEAYEAGPPIDGGFMRQVDGKTVRVVDHVYKRRADVMLEEGPLRTAARERLSLKLVPELARAFQFEATRIERYIVSCYDAETGGFFKPHRDNTTSGTAHRKFACTINLNADEYEGGDLRFPEFGGRTYRAPTGGAVVFSCSLMHEATPVTKGKRYAFLPFLYDEAGAKVREENLHTVAEDIPQHS